MSHSVLDIYLLSLIDRGLCTKYDLQRRGAVSLGSSSPALKRLQARGLLSEEKADDGTRRVRQILKLTPAGRRIARQDWRQHLDIEANLDIEAILRVVDIAAHQAAPRGEVINFLNAMASRRAHSIGVAVSIDGGITGLQEHLAAYRANAESTFLRHVAKSLSRTPRSGTSTNPPRTNFKERP